MKAIKKLFKFIKWTLIVVVVLALALVLTIPLWIGPVVTGTANMAVPGIVKTDFHLGEFGLNPYRGTLNVGDMQLANPPEFAKENCVELGKFYVRLDPMTVASKKIHIEEVTLDGLLVATTVTAGNFRQIAANAAGEKKEEEPKEAEAPAQPEAKVEAPAAEEAKEAEKKEPPKVQIDRLAIKNLKLKIGAVSVPIPDITIEGIGADKPEGATFAETWNKIYSTVLEKASALGVALGDLGKLALGTAADAANVAIDAVKNLDATAITDAANAVGEGAGAAVEAVGEAVGNLKIESMAESVGHGAGVAVDAVGEGASAAVGAVGNTAGKVIHGAGDIGSSAVKAVGTGAGAAVDAVKDVGGAAAGALKGVFGK